MLDAISKRLRAARKRLGKIKSIEDIKDKELNADQLDTVKSKAGVLAIIDELEKITPLLEKAASEEVKAAFDAKDAKDAATASKRAEKERLRAEAAAAEQDTEAPKEEEAAAAAPADDESSSVDRVLEMVYFSQLFGNGDGAPSSWAQDAERSSCLTHDQHNEGDLLTEADLSEIANFGHSLIRRAPGRTISHSEALTECKEVALTFLSDGNRLGDRLQRILSTGYFVTTPQAAEPPSTQEPEGIPGGSESSEYRNLAVSGAEAVLEAPPPHASTFAPQQALLGAEISHHPAQFYSPVYTTGPSYDQSAANAAFHSVPERHPGSGVSFMVNSTLDSGAPAYTQHPPQGPPQSAPPAPHTQEAQPPQQQGGAPQEPLQQARGHPQQQQQQSSHHPAQPQTQPSGELQMNGGVVDSSDAQVAPPNANGRDNRARRSNNRDGRRSGGGDRTQSCDMSGQPQERDGGDGGSGRGGGGRVGRPRGRGYRGRGDGEGGRSGEGGHGGRGEGRGEGRGSGGGQRQNRGHRSQGGQGQGSDSRAPTGGSQQAGNAAPGNAAPAQ